MGCPALGLAVLEWSRHQTRNPLATVRLRMLLKNKAETKIKNIVEERDEVRKKFEVLKKDMVNLKVY
jgi:hypothetical protein